MERWVYFLTASQSLIKDMPDKHLDYCPIPGRLDRHLRNLAITFSWFPKPSSKSTKRPGGPYAAIRGTRALQAPRPLISLCMGKKSPRDSPNGGPDWSIRAAPGRPADEGTHPTTSFWSDQFGTALNTQDS